MTAAATNALAKGKSAQGCLADPRNDGVLVYVNGAFVPCDQARVSIFDSGCVLGDGIPRPCATGSAAGLAAPVSDSGSGCDAGRRRAHAAFLPPTRAMG